MNCYIVEATRNLQVFQPLAQGQDEKGERESVPESKKGRQMDADGHIQMKTERHSNKKIARQVFWGRAPGGIVAFVRRSLQGIYPRIPA